MDVSSTRLPRLVLCADGGGSKVSIVIRSEDGLEVRGAAGPCNIQSVGHRAAAQSILLATYRALSLLPETHLPPGFIIPRAAASLHAHTPSPVPGDLPRGRQGPEHSDSSNHVAELPTLDVPVFTHAWLGLAGLNTGMDERGFVGYAREALCLCEDQLDLSNDVNLLAAPAIALPGVRHAVAVVAGTGTVGRTIRVSASNSSADTGETVAECGQEDLRKPGLPLETMAMAKGWGSLLCDEGSAFSLGRLAIRDVLYLADRQTSASIYSAPRPQLLPFHQDILEHFGTTQPADLITFVSLAGPSTEGLSVAAATSRRNAVIAGAARIVLKWAFLDDVPVGLGPSVPALTNTNGTGEMFDQTDVSLPSPGSPTILNDIKSSDTEGPINFHGCPAKQSHVHALRLAKKAVEPLLELTMSLLGDQTVVKPATSALVLGGGLMLSEGYRKLLVARLADSGAVFRQVVVVADAAGQGAEALAKAVFTR
ncbi:hypothetical protein IAU60_003080 [Kwoniella sp. DSM 27419]